MNLSKKSRYGITALIDLAVYARNQCVQLSSIAERNKISVKYLEQIFSGLRRAGLVKSIKGPQGGYLLAKSPESITVADVIYALDGSYLLEDERSVVSGADEKGISTAIQKLLIEQMNDQRSGHVRPSPSGRGHRPLGSASRRTACSQRPPAGAEDSRPSPVRAADTKTSCFFSWCMHIPFRRA